MTTAIAARSGAGILLAGTERTAPSFVTTLRKAWNDYWAYRTTLVELQALSNKQLSDAGFRRDALDRIAVEAVYGK